MILLIAFDLPRTTKEEQRQANHYRKTLLELGFSMKQFSVYERVVKNSETKNKIVHRLQCDIPKTGAITLYFLPNDVYNNQLTLLGEDAINKVERKPKLIIL